MFTLLLGNVTCNLYCPEATAPFYIYPISNIEGVIKTEKRYDGFNIQLKADIHWLKEDEEVEWYSMRVWKGDGILAKVPAYEHTLLHNKVSNNVIDAMDDGHHYYEENKESRMWQYYFIEFPPGVTLSSKAIFAEAGDDEELDYEIVRLEIEDSAKYNYKITEHWLHFTVARTDTRVAKRGKVTKKTKKSKGASKLDDIMS